MTRDDVRRRLQAWATWHRQRRRACYTDRIEAVEKAVTELADEQVRVIKACLLHGKSVRRIAHDLQTSRRQVLTICDNALTQLAVSIPLIDMELACEHPANG